MGGRTPEKQALRKGFDVPYDCETCCGVAGYGFKYRIHQRKLASVEDVWQHSEDKRKNPGDEDDEIAVGHSYRRDLSDKYEWERSYYESYEEADRKRAESGVHAVHDGYHHRQEHEQCAHQECLAYIHRYDLYIQNCVSLRSEIRTTFFFRLLLILLLNPRA